MHHVKNAFSYSYFLAQEQQEFLQLQLKLIIEVFNLILEFQIFKLDHSKVNNINSKDYKTSKNLHISIV
jgi:hypothetical protein